ncbi:MAG: type VI protein secretion system component VasK, partial [bacterium]
MIAKLNILLAKTIFGFSIAAWLLVIIIILLILYVFLVTRKLRQTQKKRKMNDENKTKSSSPEKPASDLSFSLRAGKQIQGSFRLLKKYLKSNFFSQGFIYRDPWYLMIGETFTGKTDILKDSGKEISVGKTIHPEFKENPPIRFWKYNKGLILEPSGEVISRTKNIALNNSWMRSFTFLNHYQGPWKKILRSLNQYRSVKPLNG